MTSARLFVRAIVVTDGRSRYLGEVLDAIAAQDFAPDSVHIATVGEVPVATPAGLNPQITVLPASASYGDAVDAVIAAFPEHEAEYVWLLHDDSAPLPDVLGALAATARKRSRAAIIGAAQVRWRDTSRLISLGSTVSRVGARRVDLVDDNDINQGQYDWRDDVLSVSLTGALVRRDAWVSLGGLDPAYRAFGDSADLCRRAWRAGHDVVVVPGALVRHAQVNLRGGREGGVTGSYSSYGLRRTGEWYHSLVWAPVWAVPLLVVWSFLSAIFRALIRIAQNEPRMAGVDLGIPWRLVGRLGSVPRSRRRARRRAAVSARSIAPLLATPASVANHIRTRYLRSYDRWRLSVTPTGVVRDELAAAGTRRRWMLGVVVIVSAGIATVTFGRWLPELAAGRMLTGSLLGVTDVGWHTLWQRTWSGWSDVGYGAASLDGSFSAAMVPFAILPGGLRLWLGIALTFGVVLAALTAWFASGAATRAVSVRAVAALAYAVWPTFLVSISQGRVGAVLAHIALPLVALGVARAVGWHRGEALANGEEYTARRIPSPSAAAGASLALAFAVAVAPVILLPSVVALGAVAALAGRRWPRVVLVAVPALVISGPALFAASRAGGLRDAWGVLAREVGPSAPSDVASPWRTLLTLDTSPADGAWYSSSAAVAAVALTVCLAAVVALVSGRAARAVRIAWFVAALGLLAAFAAQRVVVAWPDGAGTQQANGWAGPGLSLALVGALGAAAAASSGLWHSGTSTAATGVRRTAAVVCVAAAASAVLVSAVAWAWPGRPASGDVAAAEPDVLPLVAALEQQPPGSARVLTLQDVEGGAVYSVEVADGAITVAGGAGFGRDGAPLARPGVTGLPTPADLAEPVATLIGAGQGADEQLAAWGIGVIVATPQSANALAGLAQVDTLELMGASAHGTAYRVSHEDAVVTRAWIETSRGVVPVWMDGAAGHDTISAADAGTLVLAATADGEWRASVDGTPLVPVKDDFGRQAFTVPAHAGYLDIRYDDSSYRYWWWAAAIASGLALLASAPIHDRRIIGGRS